MEGFWSPHPEICCEEDYYRISICKPFLDFPLTVLLSDRFTCHRSDAFLLQMFVPASSLKYTNSDLSPVFNIFNFISKKAANIKINIKASYIYYLQMPLSSKHHLYKWNWHAVVTLSNWTKSSLNLRRVVNAKRQHKLFSDAINFCRKFAVRMLSCKCTGRKLKASWQHFTTADDVMRNSFMNKRVKVNSKELL